MNRKIIALASALTICVGAFAQETASKPAPEAHLKWYGFVRTYFAFDSRESSAGTEDLYYYMPKDRDMSGDVDLNATPSFRFASLTSRLGVDVSGYEIQGFKVGAKIETDFYSGVSGVTGTAQLRLRQAYMTMARNGSTWKIGQAWHPMAADLPDIFSLESGAPFGPFSRTPQVNFEKAMGDGMSITAAAIWQMQYTSTGPDGAKADYQRNGLIPELYAGINIKGDNSLVRVGADLLSIKPRRYGSSGIVDDRLTTLNLFEYGQFKAGDWTVKEKVTYANDGSHMNLVGGYGVSAMAEDGSWDYSATRSLSGWATFQHKKKGSNWVPSLLIGYIKELGTANEIKGTFWCKNSANAVNQMFRFQPEVLYNMGKVAFGLEYMCTGVEYGKANASKLVTDDLHWILNHRIQMMAKYTF